MQKRRPPSSQPREEHIDNPPHHPNLPLLHTEAWMCVGTSHQKFGPFSFQPSPPLPPPLPPPLFSPALLPSPLPSPLPLYSSSLHPPLHLPHSFYLFATPLPHPLSFQPKPERQIRTAFFLFTNAPASSALQPTKLQPFIFPPPSPPYCIPDSLFVGPEHVSCPSLYCVPVDQPVAAHCRRCPWLRFRQRHRQGRH